MDVKVNGHRLVGTDDPDQHTAGGSGDRRLPRLFLDRDDRPKDAAAFGTEAPVSPGRDSVDSRNSMESRLHLGIQLPASRAKSSGTSTSRAGTECHAKTRAVRSTVGRARTLSTAAARLVAARLPARSRRRSAYLAADGQGSPPARRLDDSGLDRRQRVLLLRWRDPGTGRSGSLPVARVSPGESEAEAAGREADQGPLSPVRVDDSWAVGRPRRTSAGTAEHFAGPERLYGLEVEETVDAHPASLTDSEAGALLGFGWLSFDEISRLEDRVEPPDLPGIVSSLLAIGRAGRRD